MERAVVVGVGMSGCGKFPEKSVADLVLPAVNRAMDDAGLSWKQIQAVYASHVKQGMSAGERVLYQFGMSGIPMINVENACASGSTAIYQAARAIQLGEYDLVLVVGFEKMGRGVIDSGEDTPFDIHLGLNIMPATYAFRANRHMELYGTTSEDLAKISVKSHKNAAHNPYCHFRNPVTIDEVLNSRMIADPLTLLQSCPNSDGAAAVILCSESYHRKHLQKKPVYVVGSVVRTQLYDFDEEELTRRTAQECYASAGLGPEDVNVAECHDAFTIGEIMHYEGLGFCKTGEGGRFIAEGCSEIGGKLPVNPSGGLLSRGHPLGMTGVAQVCEITWQLRGECGPRQVQNAKVGLTHTQGAGGVCSVHLFTL